jgi:hypothetical protein
MKKDIIILLLVSIILGSITASAISLASNAYFSKTISNLVGDSGEYDVIITVREEMKQDSAEHIQKIIQDTIPGAKFKEGPTLSGKTSFFIALPDSFKTKDSYDNLNKIFGSIPGGATVGILTEPRLTVRGVPEGAKKMLMDRIGKMDGVKFTFNDGASIGVLLTNANKNTAVSQQIKALLDQYQVIEISFPVGSEPANPIRSGNNIASAMEQNLKLELAQNASVDGKNDDMTSMVSTMIELKRFLSSYASQVVVAPGGDSPYHSGDTFVFQGTDAAAPVNGGAPDKNNVIVTVSAVRSDGSAEASITQGDSSQLTNPQGYSLVNNVIGNPIGSASYRSPRQELGNALGETTKLVTQVPGFAKDAQSMSKVAFGVLDQYSHSLNSMDQTLTEIQNAGTTMENATRGLTNIDTTALQNQVDSSAKTMGTLANTLQVVKLLNGDVNGAIGDVNATKQGLNNVKTTLGALNNVAGDARQAKTVVDDVVDKGQGAVASLRSFDAAGARANLDDAGSRLAQVQQVNVPLITTQLQYMAAAIPNMKDDEINHSVALLDKFIAGQVIPGARIQILTTNNISTEAVMPLVVNEVGNSNASLYSTAVGVIEPDPRGQMMSVLAEVKAILAGLTAIAITILYLALDHTALMTVFKRRRLARKIPLKGFSGFVRRLFGVFTAPERQYGMVIGAVLLTSMFVLSKGGIPYLPWIGVPVVGALLGLLVAAYTDKISPVSSDEIMAGQALGLSFKEIMREIVIPSGRPGLMQQLNKRVMKFKGSR